ncbi:MAG: hypothetical protein GY910_18045 [bacterium]|nr:hypothetical protein [bacterium]
MVQGDLIGWASGLCGGIGRLAAAAWAVGLILTAPGGLAAQTLSLEETESLVRALYYEGMPEERAERIGPAGCVRLLEMLTDPGESRSHGQILVAIGLCGPPGGFEAIRDWAEAPRSGEVDRATFRAWQALPFALGHLARHDRRALTGLERRLNDAELPDWTFRHHRGARLLSQSRRSAATCLALTGMPEAGDALDRARGSTSDPGFRAHLDETRAMHRRSERARRVRRGTHGSSP